MSARKCRKWLPVWVTFLVSDCSITSNIFRSLICSKWTCVQYNYVRLIYSYSHRNHTCLITVKVFFNKAAVSMMNYSYYTANQTLLEVVSCVDLVSDQITNTIGQFQIYQENFPTVVVELQLSNAQCCCGSISQLFLLLLYFNNAVLLHVSLFQF